MSFRPSEAKSRNPEKRMVPEALSPSQIVAAKALVGHKKEYLSSF